MTNEYTKEQWETISDYQAWQRAKKAVEIAEAEVGIAKVDLRLITDEENAWKNLTGTDYSVTLSDILNSYPFLRNF